MLALPHRKTTSTNECHNVCAYIDADSAFASKAEQQRGEQARIRQRDAESAK